MNLRMQEFVNYLNFNASDERTIRYLKGETLTAAEEEAADGLVLICVDGFPLGWAQKRGGQLKNKYPTRMEVAVMGQGKSIRLDRFLAEMKQGTRSQVKR